MSTTVMAPDDVSATAAALRALSDTQGGDQLARQLSRLVMVIADEAVRTKRFRGDLLAALTLEPGGDAGVSGALSHAQLQRMTKPELKKLIDRNGMDPDRTLKSRSTKGEMIELILAFQTAQGEAGSSTALPGQPAASADAVPADAPATGPETTGPMPAVVNPPKRRRQPSPLDPYAVAAGGGVDELRHQLQHLDLEELKDVIAEYGMNYDGRAMSWHDHHRFVDRIVEKADFGATQGNAFRSGT